MPRAAVLSVNARVEGAPPLVWDDPVFVQVWGPRFAVYVVAERDRAVFTLGRLSDDPQARDLAYDLASRFERALGGERVPMREAGARLGLSDTNQLRYAAPTGTVLVRWEGAGTVFVWAAPAPELTPADARLELVRRYLHYLGPGTSAGFANWAGIKPRFTGSNFEALQGELVPVKTSFGEAFILASDEESFRTVVEPPAPARLLPSGDPFWLFHGEARALVVPEPRLRDELWTPRVWPGAILVDGEIAGTWRRAGHRLAAHPWRKFSATEIDAVEAEAASLPLPDLDRPVEVSWEPAN